MPRHFLSVSPVDWLCSASTRKPEEKIGTVPKLTLFMRLGLMNDTFKPSSEQIITFARHDHKRVKMFSKYKTMQKNELCHIVK